MSSIYQVSDVLSWGNQGRSAKSGLEDVSPVIARAAMGFQDLYTRYSGNAGLFKQPLLVTLEMHDIIVTGY